MVIVSLICGRLPLMCARGAESRMVGIARRSNVCKLNDYSICDIIDLLICLAILISRMTVSLISIFLLTISESSTRSRSLKVLLRLKKASRAFTMSSG